MLQHALLILTTLALASCFSTPLSPHKIDIQQGNYVDQEMVAKLKQGMTRPQVRFVLGTPLVADPFHANRWDYVFRMQKKGEAAENRKITVVFEDDKLARIDGDVVPGEVAEDMRPKVTKAAPRPASGAAGPLRKTDAEDKTLKEKVAALLAEKEAGAKDEAELRKSLATLLGVEERRAAAELPRAKTVSSKEKSPPPAKQATSDPRKEKSTKVAKAKPAEKQAKAESSGDGLRASGLSADLLGALGVRYEGDGKPDEEEVVAEEDGEVDGAKPAKKRKTARKSNLKADGLSADILKTLGVPFEGDGEENAAEDEEETVAEGEERPEKGGVLDTLKNADGKSVKQQLSEKFGIEDKKEKPARESDDEDVAEGTEPAKPTFMDDMRTVLGLGSAKSGRDEKLVKVKNAKDEVEEDDAEAGDEEYEDEVADKPTFWDDLKTVIGLD